VDRDELLAKAYENLKWALYGKGKFEINRSIKRKLRYLAELFNVSRDDIFHDIFENFVSKKHYEKFDPKKGKLSTFMTHYANLSLLNIIKKYNRINGKEVSFPDEYEDRFHPEQRQCVPYLEQSVFADGNTKQASPEDLCLMMERFKAAEEFFGEDDLAVLTGMKSRKEVAQQRGLTYDAYRKQLFRKVKLFLSIMGDSEQLLN